MMTWLLVRGSYGLLYLALLAGGVGIPVPEDVVLVTGGVLAHRGVTRLGLTIAVCLAGVLSADLAIFTVARRLGPKALARPEVARLLPPSRRARIEDLLARFGGLVVLVGRHMPGLRPAIFALAAANGMPASRFFGWDLMGLCISGPLVFGLGYVFSDHLERVREDIAAAHHVMLVVAVCLALTFVIFEAWRFRRLLPRPK